MRKELGLTVLLVILCAAVTLKNPRFLSATNLRNTSVQVGMYGVFSIGMGLVIITGGIDLSVGSVFALQGIVLAMMLTGGHVYWPLATLLSFGLVVVLGIAHALLITKLKLQPFIVTLCGLMFYRGLAQFIAGDLTKGFGEENFGFLRPLAKGNIFHIPMPFVLLICTALAAWVLLHRSVYGRHLFAVGRNEEAARYSGIRTDLVIGSAYVLCMVTTAISGLLFAFDGNSVQASNFGQGYELFGVAAAVVGGCSLRGGEGSILGIVLGTILLQVLQNFVNLLGIQSSLNFAVMGAVILIGVTVDQILTQRRQKKRKIITASAAAPAATA